MPETGGLIICDAEPAGGTGDFTSEVDTGNIFDGTAENPDHGSYSYEIHYDGTNTVGYGIKTFAEQTVLYGRYYVYLDSSLVPTVTWKQLWFCGLYDDTTYAVLIGIQSNATPVFNTWIIQIQGQSIQASTANFAFSRWNRLEFSWSSTDGCVLKTGVAEGGLTTAITETGHDTGLLPDSIRFGSTYINAVVGADAKFYLDDLKLDTADWIGVYVEGGAPEGIPVQVIG